MSATLPDGPPTPPPIRRSSCTGFTPATTCRRRAASTCGSCHDYVDFAGGAAAGCTHPLARGTDGLPTPCNHTGGTQANNTLCASCHSATDIEGYHKPVVPPDPNNAWAGGTSNNTNAAYMAAAGYVPAGAAVITYEIKSVDAVDDAAISPSKRPQITFKLKKNGADVVFQTYAPAVTTELMSGFVGSPSVYFAFAVPQDGIAKPADFNATASGYIKKIWDGTATGTGAASFAAVANMQVTTVATGKYNSDPLVSSSYYTLSPYVVADNVTDYGSGFSFAASSGSATQAAGTTLVISPITGACAACHDSPTALDHMKANGGRFYAPRSSVVAPGAAAEQCLMCHGPGRVAAIGLVHER